MSTRFLVTNYEFCVQRFLGVRYGRIRKEFTEMAGNESWYGFMKIPGRDNNLLWLAAAAAAAKSLQSCLTLCDPIDGSLPGSPIPGILQARTLEWVPFPSPLTPHYFLSNPFVLSASHAGLYTIISSINWSFCLLSHFFAVALVF